MDEEKKVTILMEKWAVWLIGICIVCLIIGASFFITSKTLLAPQVSRIEIKITPDSLSEGLMYTSDQLDSLYILTKLTLESYQHYFETEHVQKEQEDSYKSFATLLLSIVVGLCGFFGFKSFKDIKDRGKEIASGTAKNIAEEVAKPVAQKAAEDYLESKLPEVVAKQFEGSFNETAISSIKNSIIEAVVPRILQEVQSQQHDDDEKEQMVEFNGEKMSPDDMFNQ